MNYLMVFICGVLINVASVLWVIAIEKDRRVLASLASVGCAIPNVFGIISAVNDVMLTIPLLVGVGVGTYLGTYLKDFISEKPL